MSKQLTRINNLSGKQKTKGNLLSKTNLSFDSKSPVSQILNLHRTTGNQAVQNLFKSGAIQPKLKIGEPGDKYELEADRIAEQVMRMPDSVCPSCLEKEEEVVNREVIRRESLPSEDSSFVQRQVGEEERKKKEEEEVIQPKLISPQITPKVQRQVEDKEKKKREEEELVQPKLFSNSIEPIVQRQFEEEEEEMLQTKENISSTAEITPNIESGINSLRGGGQPLSESVRNYFEPRFGYDFSGVRVHTGVEVNETAKSINARAFTLGNNVVFGTSGYSPETAEGKRLLAHELAHVVQQVGRKPMINRWSQKGVSDVLCRNEGKQFVEKLNKLKVYEYEKIIWKYKVLNKEGFWDVHTEESMGEFDPATGEVYVKKALSDEEASSTLFHEIIHVGQKEKKTKLKKQEEQTEEQRKLEEQENEYEAWIQTEKYRIKVGLPEQQPGFRTKKGKKYIVDEAKVREYIDELYTRTSPKQTKKYITLGIYPEGIKPIEKKWECLKTPGKGSKKSGGQVIQRSLRMDYALPGQAVQPKPLSNSIEPVVQRQFEEEEKEGMLQTKENGSSTAEVTPNIESGINSLKGGGQPLSESTRNYFEPRFGYDFSGVRVHTGVGANETAKSINARAFTIGNDVIFGSSSYSPETAEGKRLLAHELTHTIQQRSFSLDAFGQREPDAGEGMPELDYNRIADKINKAIAGLGTDEEAVYLALQKLERNKEAIKKLEEVYSNKYGETLVDAIRGDFSGEELEYALQLLNIGKEGAAEAISKAVIDEAYLKTAAKRLREAVEGAGTEEEIIYAVLLPFNRNADHLRAVKKAYSDEYKEDLRDRLVSELSGSELDYVLYLLGEGPKGLDIKYAMEFAEQVLTYIKSEAEKEAKSPPSIDPGSNLYKVLKDKYLKDYIANPTEEEGKKAVEKIGRKMEGRRTSSGVIEVKPEGGAWRPAENRWEEGAIVFWNKEALPELPAELKDLPLFKNIKTLPKDLSAATDILIKENLINLPYLDVPFLVGKPEIATEDTMADVIKGGKNLSQLMHWATGVKYSDNSPQALRELFIAYEIWHLEGWDIFGQDPINDLIAEEQGRLLGTELRKGSAGAIKDEATLLTFLNESFLEARAWVGALLRMRRAELDAWILAEEQKPGKEHWHGSRPLVLWPTKTVAQMLASGMSIEDVKKSGLVKSQIEIYTLIYEADEWEKTKGPIEVTELQKALVEGNLDPILKVMAKGSGASIGEMKEASENVEGLKGVDKKELKLRDPSEIEIPFPIGCFKEDTRILCENSSWKTISEMKAGDKVISFNETRQSLEVCVVKKVHIRSPQPYLRIELDNAGILNITPHHRLFVGHGWLQAGDIKVGDKLLYYDVPSNGFSEPRIVYVEEKSAESSVYDLTVEKCNNYFAEGFLAHNKIY